MARLRHLTEQDHRTSSKDSHVKETSGSICFPICICPDCLQRPLLTSSPFYASGLHTCVWCMGCEYLCVCVGGGVCVCVGKDLIFTDGDLSVDKISPQWIIPKTIPGSQSQVWPENTGLRIHQDLVVNISGLSQGHNEVLVTWYQAAFECLMFWLLKKLVHLLIMFINFWWIVCLHLCLIFKALLKIFITTLYILSIWAPWQNFAIFFPSLALVFH